MPAWITPRRLAAAAILYAVFVAGWHLGQPLPPECLAEAEAAARPPAQDDGLFGDATLDTTFSATLVDTTASDGADCSWETHPRLLAWLQGDWR
ncbi:hypothetical protein [Streptomyces sp. Da 82-17]|uniref:hypothetical protein n=1 Tax=Streptomyces sp. Da 82-17 TaxID=3377116 RepID=UPI0038D4592B